MTDEALELHIAPSNKDDTTFNRIVLSGLDIVIPLEIDLDEDPKTDDAIRLIDRDGDYSRVLEDGDDDVVRDAHAPFLRCTFRVVPPGVYDVDVRLHNKWHTVIAGLQVTSRSVRLNGESFVGTNNLGEFAEADPVPADDDSDDEVAADTVDCPL